MKKKIIFMGSPEEVCCILKTLAEENPNYHLSAVISQPAKPVGRKKQLEDPPVAQYAKAQNIPCLQPHKASSADFLIELQNLAPDIIITAAYGQILSKAFLAIPKRATINIHPSLLPLYRGATPVQSALVDGQETTGLSILFTTFKLDSGNLILQKEEPILPNETSPQLLQRLFEDAATEIFTALDKLEDQSFEGSPQEDSQATHCKKLNKEMGKIDWTCNAKKIYNLYRGLHGWPGVRTQHNNQDVIITEMIGIIEATGLKSGEFCLSDDKQSIHVGCLDSAIAIKKVKPAGSKEIRAVDFWNGTVKKIGLKHFD